MVEESTASARLTRRRMMRAVCDVRRKFSVYDCFARGVSRERVPFLLQVRPLVSHNKDHYEKRQQHLSHFLRPASSARTNFCQTSKSPISHWHAVGVACRCRRIENSLKAYRPKHSLLQGRLPNMNSLNSLTEYREVPSRCPPASGVAPALASFHPRHRWGQGN